MRVRIDATDILNEAIQAGRLPKTIRAAAWRAVRKVSFALERKIKSDMPVDTGRARASWGHWTSQDTNNPEASEEDAHWEDSEGGLYTVQGSNVEYIDYLNDGHSAQAPAGFIDMATVRAEDELDSEIGKELGALP
jgi:hypothetical protein